MTSCNLLLWVESWLRATLQKFACIHSMLVSKCVNSTAYGSVFWCVILFRAVGDVFCQLLNNYNGAYFAYCASFYVWLDWSQWLLYCPLINESFSVFTHSGLQFIYTSSVLLLVEAIIELMFEYFTCLMWELGDCVAGRVVGSRVAPDEGVQPWPIAPRCTYLCSLWSMMKPHLAETYYAPRFCFSLKLMLLVYFLGCFSLHNMHCILQVIPQVITIEFQFWQIHFSLSSPWHSMQPCQQQHLVTVTRDWGALLVAFQLSARSSTFPLISSLYFLYWPLNYLAIKCCSRTVYVNCTVLLYWIKCLARESRLFGPYDSKARYQNAFGHRIGHNQFVLVADFIRIELVLFGFLPHVHSLNQ